MGVQDTRGGEAGTRWECRFRRVEIRRRFFLCKGEENLREIFVAPLLKDDSEKRTAWAEGRSKRNRKPTQKTDP
jgi:hypothetical protein